MLSAWVEQGPAPIVDGQTEGLSVPGVGKNPVVGAVESVATDPSNPDIIYAGTVNGGIWKTTNGTSTNPTWVPKTDSLPSMTIADIEISPLDPTHKTLYAATGDLEYSSGHDGSPSGAGIYKSTDGGDTWTHLGSASFDGRPLRNVVPTALTENGGQVVLTDVRDPSTGNDGVWRSTDGGTSWTRISGSGGLPDGGVSFLTGDPGNPNRFYAAIPASDALNGLIFNSSSPGIYRSDDGGLTWHVVNTGLQQLANSVRIELAIHNDPANNQVYAAVLTPQGNGYGVDKFYVSNNQGNQWTPLSGLPNLASFEPGQQGNIHFAMVPDPSQPNVLFVSGDRQPSTSATGDWTGINFRATLDSIVNNQVNTSWASLDGAGSNATSPHADSRGMIFDANGNILQVDDGGIYRLSNPNDPATRSWSSVDGNLRDSEVYSVAYDDVNHTIIAGAQDVGSSQQMSQNGQIWTEVQQGDGGITATDNTSTPGASYHYTEYTNAVDLQYQEFDQNGNQIGVTHFVSLIVTNVGNQDLRKLDPTAFIQSYRLNDVDPTRFMIGTGDGSGGGHIYDSTDRGDHLTREPDNVGASYSVYGYDYGGRFQGVANPDIAFVGYYSGALGNGGMLLRTTAGASFTRLASYPGFVPRAIIMDPQDDERAFDVDLNGHVYATFDQGLDWVDITGNLGSLTTTSNLRTIGIVSPTGDLSDDILMVGGQGGVFAVRNPGQTGGTLNWSPLGTGLSDAIVTDLHYDQRDNVVVIGTFGRGVWTLSNPSAALNPGTISGEVFNDANDNGALDPGEAGLSGWTVFIDPDNDGHLAAGDPTAVTDANGNFSFSGLAAGAYNVFQVLQSGWNETDPGPGYHWVVTLGAGGQASVNFGDYQPAPPPGMISGVVYNDANDNDTQDPGEVGLSGWTVFIDPDNDGQLAPGDPTATTDANGNFSFTGLAAGTYNVLEVLQTTWKQTQPAAGTHWVVTLSAGGQSSVNFGNYQAPITGTISGVVYNDINDNGSKDSGEPGLRGWTVFIDANHNGQLEAGDPAAATDASGNFSFTGLTAGTYDVYEALQSGWNETDPGPGYYWVVTLRAGGQASVNFGNYQPPQTGTISGVVYNDVNDNGTRDSSESGLSGWTVFIDANFDGQPDFGDMITTTDANGNFSFTGLAAGTYDVYEVVQNGWNETEPGPGYYWIVTLSAGGQSSVNFGNFQPGTISGVVYNDVNDNGSKDPGEAGLSGWTVFIDPDNDGQLAPGDPTAITDAGGNFSFTGLTAGTYNVFEVLQNGWNETDPGPGYHWIVTLSSGGQSSVNFGNYLPPAPAGSISGVVYNDVNDNGSKDSGEPGLSGWTLFIDPDNDGHLAAGDPTAITDANGSFSFNGLTAATYNVFQVLQTGWQQTDPTEGYHWVVTLGAGGQSSVNFGDVQVGTISGMVFKDLNANGSKDAGEPGLSGWTVFIDPDNDGHLAAGDPTATTDANGNFSLTGLTAGTYHVFEVLQTGWQQTQPTAGYHWWVNLSAGDTVSSLNFGDSQVGTISGVVFNDVNDNGSKDSGEPGLGGWTLFIDPDNDGQLAAGDPTAITDANGNFSFTGLTGGTYHVFEVLQTGWQQTQPTAGTHWVVTLSAGGQSSVNFGDSQVGTISGVVYNDVNANGSKDSGEPGLGGWTLFIDPDNDGQLTAGDPTATTDANGNFSFAGLTAGTYYLYEVLQTGWRESHPASGYGWKVALSAGGQVFGNDFGNYEPGTLQFSSSTYSVSEAGSSVTITATRTGGSSGAVTVSYATSDGTGKAETDYTTVSNTLSWADGETSSKTFTIPILDRGLTRGSKTVNVMLTGASGGASVGSPSTAVLTILDNDAPAVLQFANGQFTADITSGSAQVVLTRAGNLSATVSVVVSSPGGPDVAPFQQTITFGPSVQSATVAIPIQNDGQPGESDVSIPLSLSSPGPGASLGTTTSAALVVHDNNPFPTPVIITSLQLPAIKVKTGSGKKAKTKTETVVQLHLSGPLNGAGNLRAYKLLSGQTKRGVTTFKTVVPLASVVYSSTALTVTLIPTGKLNLSKPEQLRITAALLTDAYGRPLDGNYDGQPGGNFVATFKNRGITFAQVQSKSRTGALSASAVDAVLAEGLIPSPRTPRERRHALHLSDH